ncbi:MAG: DegV family protein [Clostridiales bacterium]|nr:DegV family protein [Clostridiales bacterium]
MSFRLFTDTSANLDSSYLELNHVDVVPFSYVFNGEQLTCLDTEAFDGVPADEYYAALKSGSRVRTSQITPEEYRSYFEPALESGDDVLFISMSSGISNSFNSSVVAVNELREKYPERKIRAVDTLAASLGEGIMVMRAIALRDSGLDLDTVADEIERRVQSMYQVVLIEDLMHLHRGGRVSAPKALLGTVLGIRPILKGDDGGHLVVCSKVRGRKKGLAALADKYGELVDRSAPGTVGIAYTDCKDDAYALRDMLEGIFAPKEFLVVRYEPVTGSYVGPGTVALFFEGADGVRQK